MVRLDQETVECNEDDAAGASGAPVPGLLMVYSEHQARLVALPLREREIVLGRGECAGTVLSDAAMSRQHARVRHSGPRFELCDLGGRNGSHVDGVRVAANQWAPISTVARVGSSLFLPCADVRPYVRGEVVRRPDGRLHGPTSQAVLAAIQRAARNGSTLHLHGESGAGKEGAARDFHAAGPRAHGPFVAVNCAAIPEGISERLLFGAKKGAFSGATGDVDGYLQAANGGTLFLDEVAELDLAVQAKLLRVLESREVLALGATRASAVDLRVCSATHRDLRALVADGKLREDLYFRIGRPEVVVPPLRARRDELPWLAQSVLGRHTGLVCSAGFLEACLLRRWPGNVRELLSEVELAAQEALAAGAERVEAHHLAPRAGLEFRAEGAGQVVAQSGGASSEPAPARPPGGFRSAEGKEVLVACLARTEGNVSRAARLLGLHRTQLRRLLAFHGLEASELEE